MDVSENSGTPKSSMLIGFSIINHPFWGTPIFGTTHIYPNQQIFLIAAQIFEIFVSKFFLPLSSLKRTCITLPMRIQKNLSLFNTIKQVDIFQPAMYLCSFAGVFLKNTRFSSSAWRSGRWHCTTAMAWNRASSKAQSSTFDDWSGMIPQRPGGLVLPGNYCWWFGNPVPNHRLDGAKNRKTMGYLIFTISTWQVN